MRLKNKKTGEIVELFGISCKGLLTFLQFKDKRGNFKFECNSLAELEDEWEDYKQPDKFYYIDADGYIKSHSVDDRDFNNVKDGVENLIAIGNYFETKEEAERAAEKLKALERLTNHGLRLTLNKFQRRIEYDFKAGGINSTYNAEDALKDLDICFGGKE